MRISCQVSGKKKKTQSLEIVEIENGDGVKEEFTVISFGIDLQASLM